MEALDKQIAGDWYDMRQVLDDHHAYEEHLDIQERELGILLQDLRLSVERGPVELKRTTVNAVLSFAESLQFDAKAFQEFGRHAEELKKLAYLSLLQRSFCTTEISPRRAEAQGADTMTDAVRQTDFKTIVGNVQKRISENQAAKSHPMIKNILLQVGVYRRELENMKELAPNIPKEKSAAFTANYKKTFDEITRKVQDSYAALLREEEGPEKDARPKSMFLRFDVKGLAPFFASQAQEFARIRSILTYAEKERYKTLDILGEILRKRDNTISLIDRELKNYERFWFGHGDELAREFGTELTTYMARRLSVAVGETE